MGYGGKLLKSESSSQRMWAWSAFLGVLVISLLPIACGGSAPVATSGLSKSLLGQPYIHGAGEFGFTPRRAGQLMRAVSLVRL